MKQVIVQSAIILMFSMNTHFSRLVSAPWYDCGYTKFGSSGFDESKKEIHFGGKDEDGKTWPTSTGLSLDFLQRPFLKGLPEPTYKGYNKGQVLSIVYKAKISGGGSSPVGMICAGSGGAGSSCSDPGYTEPGSYNRYYSGDNEFIGVAGGLVGFGSASDNFSIIAPPEKDDEVSCSSLQGSIEIEVIAVIFKADRYPNQLGDEGLYDADGNEILVDGERIEYVVQTAGGKIIHYGSKSPTSFEALNALPRTGQAIGKWDLHRHEGTDKPPCSFGVTSYGGLRLSVSKEMPQNSCDANKTTCSGTINEDKSATVSAEVIDTTRDRMGKWEGSACPCEGSTSASCKFEFGKMKNEDDNLIAQSCRVSSATIPSCQIIAAGNNSPFTITYSEPGFGKYAGGGFGGSNGNGGNLKEGKTVTATVDDASAASKFGRWEGKDCPCDGSTSKSCTFTYKLDDLKKCVKQVCEPSSLESTSRCSGAMLSFSNGGATPNNCLAKLNEGVRYHEFSFPTWQSYGCAISKKNAISELEFSASVNSQWCSAWGGKMKDEALQVLADTCGNPAYLSPNIEEHSNGYGVSKFSECTGEDMLTHASELICEKAFGYKYTSTGAPHPLYTFDFGSWDSIDQDVLNKVTTACTAKSGKLHNYAQAEYKQVGKDSTRIMYHRGNVCCVEKYK